MGNYNSNARLPRFELDCIKYECKYVFKNKEEMKCPLCGADGPGNYPTLFKYGTVKIIKT